MPFFNLVSQWKSRVLDPAIDARMRQAGEAGLAAAREHVPVRTGQLRDSLGYHYDPQDKVLTLYADKSYAIFVETGTKRTAARPYLRPGLAAMGRVWGGSVDVQFTGAAPAYHKRVIAFTGGKIGKAKLRLGHRLPKRNAYRR